MSFRVFNEEAVKDYERFRKQEVRDLRGVLAAHIKAQIALCKLVCCIFFGNQETKQTVNLIIAFDTKIISFTCK